MVSHGRKNLDKICSELGIEMTTASNCYIGNSMDRNFLNILHDKNCNIDELNYLMKRLDGFSQKRDKDFMLHPLQKILRQWQSG